MSTDDLMYVQMTRASEILYLASSEGFLRVRVGSPKWTDIFVNEFGFKEPWLKYYPALLKFEKLELSKCFEDCMKELDENNHKKRFLLQHVYMCGNAFPLTIREYPPFKRLYDQHVKKYGRR